MRKSKIDERRRVSRLVAREMVHSGLTPRGKNLQLRSMVLERMRRQADASLYYFAKYLIGFNDMEIQPHWELCKFIQRYLWEDMLILLPRGTFKSSVISVALPLWLFTKNRNLRILLSSYKLSNSKGFLGLVKRNIEQNRLFRLLYGDWVNKDGVWHSSALSLAGRERFRAENSFTASSTKSSETSQHHDLAIIDDPQTEENISSKDMIDAVETYIELLLPILDPMTGNPVGRSRPLQGAADRQGPRIIVGTRWLFDDVYGRIIAEEKKRRKRGEAPAVHMLVRKAVTRNKKVYFPARFSIAYLQQLKVKARMSNYVYSCQYLNDPQPEEDQVFKLENLGFFHSTQRVMQGVISPMPQKFNFFSTLDPSLGETDESDYAAFVTNAVDVSSNMYCWEVIRDKFVGNEALIAVMFDIHERLRPLRFGVETVQFQKSLYWGFKGEARRRGKWFHVQPLTTDNQIRKDLRIQGFEPFVTQHKFYLRVKEETDLTQSPEDLYYALVDGQDAMADEMLRFPLSQTKDCIDAQAYMPQLIFPVSGKEPDRVAHPRSFKALQERMKRSRRVLSRR